MKAYRDIDSAIGALKRTSSVIVTPSATEELLRRVLQPGAAGLDQQRFELMHELQEDPQPNRDGSLDFVNVSDDDVLSIHDGYPTDGEVHEFVVGWDCWQLWRK